MKSAGAGVAKTQGILLKASAIPEGSPAAAETSPLTYSKVMGSTDPIYRPLFLLWELWGLHPSVNGLCFFSFPFLLGPNLSSRAGRGLLLAIGGKQSPEDGFVHPCPGEDMVDPCLFQFVPRVRLRMR